MDDHSPTPRAEPTPAASSRRHALWPLAAVAIVAVTGAGAGAYFGLRGAAGPGSGAGASPPARAFAAAAYDEAAHQVVLFGGVGAAGAALDDTWTWDGSAWTQQHPHTSPPARAYAAMTYDPKNRDVVLVGGHSLGSQPPSVCSGSASVSGPNATPAPAPARSPMPCASTEPTDFHDTWLWDGSTWHAGGTLPAELMGDSPALGTDPTTGQVLLLLQNFAPPAARMCPEPAPIVGGGGSGGPVVQPAIACATPVTPTLHAWLWSGDQWSLLSAASPPAGPGVPIGGLGSLVADPTSGHLVVFKADFQVVCAAATPPAVAAPCPLNAGAGEGSSGSKTPATMPTVPAPSIPPATEPLVCCADTATTWTGSGWSKAATYERGPEVLSAALAGDPAQHDVVGLTPLGTWTWNGAAWKQEHPSASPAPTEGGTLVYDGASKRLLLFGGQPIATGPLLSPASRSSAVAVSDALWAWDGTTWSQLSGAKASPAPSLTPVPTQSFEPPAPPIPASPPPISVPLPSLQPARCSPIATSEPSGGASTEPAETCVVLATPVPTSSPAAP